MISRVVFAVALLSAGCFGFAQLGEPLGVSVRAGLVFPSNAAAKAEGDQIFGIGAEFALDLLDFLPIVGDTYVSVDWYGAGDFSSMPILLNARFDQGDLYYSAGVGYTFVRIPEFPSGSREESGFAFQVSIGKNLDLGDSPIFVEAKYFGSSESVATGFGVYAGVRF